MGRQSLDLVLLLFDLGIGEIDPWHQLCGMSPSLIQRLNKYVSSGINTLKASFNRRELISVIAQE